MKDPGLSYRFHPFFPVQGLPPAALNPKHFQILGDIIQLSLSQPARFPPAPRMLVKNLLGNSVLHPQNMTKVLQPPVLYVRNEFELPIEFVDLVIHPDAPLPLLTDCAKDLAKNLLFPHSKPVLVTL
jgi:hypothetical protein